MLEPENLINEQLQSMNLEQLKELMGAVEEQGRIFDGMNLSDILSRLLKGETLFSWNHLLNNLLAIFFTEIKSAIFFSVQIVAICILVGLLKNMSSSFSDQAASKLGVTVAGCSIIMICLKGLMEVYQLCVTSISTMTFAMQVLLPVLIPLLIAMGKISSGGILNPAILSAITLLSTAVLQFILPAVFLSCIFVLVNSLSEKDYIKKLAVFLRNFAVLAMGLSVTLFSGLTAIQGIATQTADGILMKTARFSLDNFIPIIGGFASDSVDMVTSCTGILKNGVGIFGVLIILTLLILPLIKLFAVALIYKVAAIIVEPIGPKNISACLSELGNTVITLAVILFLGALMFLIFLSIIISIGTL